MDVVTGRPKAEPRTGKKVTSQKIETATKTGVLSLTGHSLKEIPESVWAVEKMTTLDLTSNEIKVIPADIRKLALLKTLKLDGNKLVDFPDEISELPKLATLSAGDNILRPGALSKLPKPPNCKLVKLSLSKNRLGNSSLEDSSFFTSLQNLIVSSNHISTIPPTIASLVCLLELDLDDNMIEVLPLEMGKLVKLKILSLRNNQIQGDMIKSSGYQSLPECLFTDTNLERLNLEGNPITRRQLNEFKGVDAWLDRCSKTKKKDLALYMS
jgi:Leucine-rich repeat (LRR) protein